MWNTLLCHDNAQVKEKSCTICSKSTIISVDAKQGCLMLGILSKSKGHILRVAAVMHVLFNRENPQNISSTISEAAIKAADSFVSVCIQHAAFLGDRGQVSEAIENIVQVQQGITNLYEIIWLCDIRIQCVLTEMCMYYNMSMISVKQIEIPL